VRTSASRLCWAWLQDDDRRLSGPSSRVVVEGLVELAYRYRLHDTTGDDLGTVEHPAPNVGPGDALVLPGGREALVTARVETDGGPLAALLEVFISPTRKSSAVD
jgi:hypothetical protein